MPEFNTSQIMVLGRNGTERPWRYSTLPDANGNGGVKQVLPGVVILMTDEAADELRALAAAADKTEIDQWLYRVSCETPLPAGTIGVRPELNEWRVPIWAGMTTCIAWRIRAVVWDDPTITPPLSVRRIMRQLYT